MCLGIPGQVVELLEGNHELARIDVGGVGRIVNVGLLIDEPLAPGDWVLIHVGFAMARIDEEEAAQALEGLMLMGNIYAEELDQMAGSTVTTDPDLPDWAR